MCEHTGGVLREPVLIIHRDICREHSLIGRCDFLMNEAVNSLSAAAGPGLSITRNPIANLASDSATAELAWVRVCVLWRPGAPVRERRQDDDCTAPRVGMIFAKPRPTIFSENVQSFFFQAEDGIRDSVASRGLGDVYKRQYVAKERFAG